MIVNSDKNFTVEIGFKEKVYEKSEHKKNLENNLIEIKDLFKENYQDQTIMHMLINGYIVNGERRSSHKGDSYNDHSSIETKFISISNDFLDSLEKLLEKYQIKIIQYICGDYVHNYFVDNNLELSSMAYQLKNGLNENEVILVPKHIENRGFFEKFFQLFS